MFEILLYISDITTNLCTCTFTALQHHKDKQTGINICKGIGTEFCIACVKNVTIAKLFVTNEGQNELHVDHEIPLNFYQRVIF